MAFKTLAEQLESVQKAIAKIESGGQQQGIAGRSVQRADYQVLLKRESRLKAMLKRKNQPNANYHYFVHE